MAGRGGRREGAGRPPTKGPRLAPDITAIEYLRSVMLDPEASASRRDRAAEVLARYTAVPAPRPQPLGKKEQAELDARNAAKGTPWENLLEWPAKSCRPAPEQEARDVEWEAQAPQREQEHKAKWDALLNRRPVSESADWRPDLDYSPSRIPGERVKSNSAPGDE